MNAVMLLRCATCEAVYFLHGDFLESEGQIIRMAETPHEDCEKCILIATECGFE